MEQGIKFVITGDTSGLVSAEKQAAKAIDELNKKIGSLQSEIAQNIKISQGYEKAISDLTKEYRAGSIGATQYGKSLDRLQRDEKETQIETQRLRKELSLLRADQRSLSGAYPALTKNTKAYTKSQSNASAGAVEFGRLLGDLPYGIQGVANNIQQLAFVMGGGAGLQIGVALVTAALVAFGDELFKSTSATEKQKKELEELRKTLDNYKESLRGVAAARLEGQRDAVKELTTLKLLKRQLDDTSLSQEEREEAYRELQKLYPAYFGNIKQEQALAGALETQYKNLTTALLEKAQAQAAADLITENKREQLTIEGKLLEIDQKIAKADETRTKALERQKTEVANARFLANQAYKAEQDIVKLQEEKNKLTERNTSLIEDNLRLVEEVGNQGGIVPFSSGGGGGDGGGGTTDEADKERKKLNALLLKLDKQLFKEEQDLAKESAEQMTSEVSQIFADSGGLGAHIIQADEIESEVERSISSIEELERAIQALGGTVGDSLGEASTTFFKELENVDLNTALVDFFEGLQDADLSGIEMKIRSAKLAAAALQEGFNILATGITNDMMQSEKAIDRFLGTLINGALKAIGVALSQSIANAILGGTQSGVGTGPFAAFTTPGFIASMVATVFGAFAAIPSFAQGGPISGGSFSGDKVPIMANSGEYVLTAQDQGYLTNFLRGNTGGTTNTGGAVTVTGRIEAEGTKLVTVITNSQDRNNRLGGSRKL